MTKTIKQALIDEVHYPLPSGFAENKLFARGLNPECVINTAHEGADTDIECGIGVLTSNPFKGAVADSLYSLIESPSFSEAGKSISLGDKTLILRKVNSLYNAIGEKSVGEPMVHFGL